MLLSRTRSPSPRWNRLGVASLAHAIALLSCISLSLSHARAQDLAPAPLRSATARDAAPSPPSSALEPAGLAAEREAATPIVIASCPDRPDRAEPSPNAAAQQRPTATEPLDARLQRRHLEDPTQVRVRVEEQERRSRTLGWQSVTKGTLLGAATALLAWSTRDRDASNSRKGVTVSDRDPRTSSSAPGTVKLPFVARALAGLGVNPYVVLSRPARGGPASAVPAGLAFGRALP